MPTGLAEASGSKAGGSEPGGPEPGRRGRGNAPFLARWFATFSFIGLFPFAPATAASLVVTVLLYILPPIPALPMVAGIVVFFFLGVWAATLAERQYGHDPGEAVCDEVVGMAISLFLAPRDPKIFLAAFLLFRFFDIVKPWPVRKLESLPRGWGIMADDTLAGIYAWAVLQGGLRLLERMG